MPDIPGAVITGEPVPVTGCDFVPDALEAILAAAAEGLILLRRYEELPGPMLEWIGKSIKQEYADPGSSPAYRHFLRGKFPEITAGLGEFAYAFHQNE